MGEEKKIDVNLTESELGYIVASSFAVLQHIPEDSLWTYTNFNKEQIKEFIVKIRTIIDKNDFDI